jgi:hypothetical protein
MEKKEWVDRPGTGTIYKNEKYVAGGTQPYARGTVKDLEGNDLQIALFMPKSDRIKGFNAVLSRPGEWRRSEAQTVTVTTTTVTPEDLSASEDDLPF